MKTETILRKKPDLKEATLTVVEAGAFGGFIIATDYVDEKMGLDQDTLKSVSNLAPVVLSVISTAGTAMTKGGTQRGMRDVQLMSTPFAVISVTRVLRARGVFGKLFKKKARDSIDHSRKFGHDRKGGRSTMGASEMSFSGLDAV